MMPLFNQDISEWQRCELKSCGGLAAGRVTSGDQVTYLCRSHAAMLIGEAVLDALAEKPAAKGIGKKAAAKVTA